MHIGIVRTITLMIPAVIGVINIIAEIIIVFVADLRRPTNDTQSVINSVSGIVGIQFINLGLVLVFANINMKFEGSGNFLSWLDGEFDDFNTPFYQKVAPQIVITMFIEILAPHVYPFLLVMYYKTRACCDRGCSCDNTKTK